MHQHFIDICVHFWNARVHSVPLRALPAWVWCLRLGGLRSPQQQNSPWPSPNGRFDLQKSIHSTIHRYHRLSRIIGYLMIHFLGWLMGLVPLKWEIEQTASSNTTTHLAGTRTPFRLPKVESIDNQPLLFVVAYFLSPVDVLLRLFDVFGYARIEFSCHLTKKSLFLTMRTPFWLSKIAPIDNPPQSAVVLYCSWGNSALIRLIVASGTTKMDLWTTKKDNKETTQQTNTFSTRKTYYKQHFDILIISIVFYLVYICFFDSKESFWGCCLSSRRSSVVVQQRKKGTLQDAEFGIKTASDAETNTTIHSSIKKLVYAIDASTKFRLVDVFSATGRHCCYCFNRTLTQPGKKWRSKKERLHFKNLITVRFQFSLIRWLLGLKCITLS